MEQRNKRVLVIGGAYQGKLEFVLQTFGLALEQVMDYKTILSGGFDKVEERIIAINQFHLVMKHWIEQEREPEKLVDWIVEKQKICVIISNEIGGGLVPMEKTERYYREQTGRALCKLAEKADEVYRVQCGIASRIKG